MSRATDEKHELIARRHKARQYALQALYQWRMSGSSLNQIEAEFRTDNDFTKVDEEYFHTLLHDVPARASDLDEEISCSLTDRSIDEIGPVEISLLRMAIHELTTRADVPYKVVINEAVSLARKFGPEESFRFVNAVLDRVATRHRAAERNSSGH
jgi:N utilization substance protein B